ncbi:hypothetical protein DP939_29900 [Spongiactinospora rosea]|uniref:Protein-glutamine gamma-glutamyltransferase-like C-terminal domain-containing protein n=2 Tax=Spongiactinospora rosea TaxID=2248750 RepID=A0A366LRQ0_9ACTN|nr:hypothetical protein DP939_29900 [Spongiactinospora rosea]
MIVRHVRQFLGDLADSLGGDGDTVPLSAIGLVLILAALAGLLVWSSRRATRARAAAAPEGIFGERVLTAAEHRAAAERHAADGRYAEAVRERLRAIARDLEERAVLDPGPGRTAAELAEEAGRALPAFATGLRSAARVFDDVTYGQLPGTAEGYAGLRDLDERIGKARPAAMASASGSLEPPR